MMTNENSATHEPSEELSRLAAAHGVSLDFWDFMGHHRVVSAEAVVAVLAALGVDASTSQAVNDALADLEDAPWRDVLPPCTVVRAGREHHVPVHLPAGTSLTVWVELEGGERRDLTQLDHWYPPREVDGVWLGRATYLLPGDLPLGWHTVVASLEVGGEHRAQLAVTPQSLARPDATLSGGRGWGFMAQLYSVRSRNSWGFGDAADLLELSSVSGDLGADFLLINPLHAGEVVPPLTASPYLPTSRRFFNPLYIRPEDIREVAYLPAQQRTLVEWAAEEVRPANSSSAPIDRDAAWKAKKSALEVVFAAPRSPARQRAFERFRAQEGLGLENFALWSALTEHFAGSEWPSEAEDVRSPLVARLRRELSERIDFYCWLQWVMDEQLEAAQGTATSSGMGIGIMHDLAVGVHPGGADVWSLPEAFAKGVTVGAPADWFNQQGQDWSQPPWRPDALARLAYAPLRDLVRTILRHAGAVRIDHIVGLFRLWWVPQGMSAAEGTYVRYDHEAMLGVLVLEAHRAGAVVIGEDLGTVEPWAREYMKERGILGTSILWFEKTHDGWPLPAEDYRWLALSTITTHDLPPTAGYLAEEHVDLRDRLGLLAEPIEKVRGDARTERERMLGALHDRGLLPPDASERQVVEALHRYIVRTPSVLLGVSLADAVGERRTQNQPGTDQEYPNWKVPLADGAENAVLVEDLAGNARLTSLVAAITGDLA
jgi:4-alpha-glucanotransferase